MRSDDVSKIEREMVTFSRPLYLLLLVILAIGCQPTGEPEEQIEVAVVEEAYLTPRDTLANVDSPAIWHGSDDQAWLLATAKEANSVQVFDLDTGAPRRALGEAGSGAGQMLRPNGIAVIDTLAFVVERDNARVQVFALPSGHSVGMLGLGELRRPYGLTLAPSTTGYRLYVTDNYEAPDESIPPNDELGERVKQFAVTVAADTVKAMLVRTFGDTTGTGVLRVVESLYADAEYGRLLIAEEEEGRSHIKVYTFAGASTEMTIDSTYFPNQAEGIALYGCPDGNGHWITTDQADSVSTFHVFDRSTLTYQGAFRGAVTRNTDGIALTQTPTPRFPQGTFAAVHDDGNVAVFDWANIASTLDLRTDCLLP